MNLHLTDLDPTDLSRIVDALRGWADEHALSIAEAAASWGEGNNLDYLARMRGVNERVREQADEVEGQLRTQCLAVIGRV